jgi:hypothetical protein
MWLEHDLGVDHVRKVHCQMQISGLPRRTSCRMSKVVKTAATKMAEIVVWKGLIKSVSLQKRRQTEPSNPTTISSYPYRGLLTNRDGRFGKSHAAFAVRPSGACLH